MFQAWLVKMAKIAANSTPSWLPGNRFMNMVTVKVKKPRTGTDCRMSSAGTISISAFFERAAAVATTKVKTSEAPRAANMRSVVRRAYSGKWTASRVTGEVFSCDSGSPICSTP